MEFLLFLLRRVLWSLLVLFGLWFLGWGQLCESFLGPIQPESVVFYCLLGLTIAQVRREEAP